MKEIYPKALIKSSVQCHLCQRGHVSPWPSILPLLPSQSHGQAEATTPSEDTWAPTHPAVPVMIHSLEMLLDDSKLHGDEEVTGCTMGCLYLLYKMLQSNFCRGQKETVITGLKCQRHWTSFLTFRATSTRAWDSVTRGPSCHCTEKPRRAGGGPTWWQPSCWDRTSSPWVRSWSL